MRMDTLCDDELGIEVHRFFCKCGSAEHILEIDKDNSQGSLEICYYGGAKCGLGFFGRIKALFNITSQSWAEFIVSPEDRYELAKLISPEEDVKVE